MQFFAHIIDWISAYPKGQIVLAYIYNLDSFQVWMIIGIIALLFAFLVYRHFGYTMLWVLLFSYLIAYTIYSSNIFKFKQEQDESYGRRMQDIQTEMEKK